MGVASSRGPAGDEPDVAFMRRALALAENGLGLAAPNPMVGAVVASAAGDVVAEGWHEGQGTRHAEVMALDAAGDLTRGGTLYTTLEPCSHQGRTPPCAPRIADSGVARVVAGARDPNPVVDGRGFGILRDRGVEVVEGILREEADELIAGFARHVLTGNPLVTLKMAASLDGKVAARDGSSQWTTSEEARRDVHRLRARAGAVMIGAGTAVADRPRLTVRLDGYRGRQPVRIVMDSSGRTPADGPLFDGSAPTLMVTTGRAPKDAVAGWEAVGAEVWVAGDGAIRLSESPLFEFLYDRWKVQEVLVEGGPTLAWSLLDEGIVDRVVLYLAPKLIGGESAPGILGGKGIDSLADALALENVRIERIGPDLKVVADVHRDR